MSSFRILLARSDMFLKNRLPPVMARKSADIRPLQPVQNREPNPHIHRLRCRLHLPALCTGGTSVKGVAVTEVASNQIGHAPHIRGWGLEVIAVAPSPR